MIALRNTAACPALVASAPPSRQQCMILQQVIPEITNQITVQEAITDETKIIQVYRMNLLAKYIKKRKCVSIFGTDPKVDKDIVLKESFMDILIKIAKTKDLNCHSDCPFICPKIDLKALGLDKVENTCIGTKENVCDECPNDKSKNEISEEEENEQDSNNIIESLKRVIEHMSSEEAIAGCPFVCQKIYEKSLTLHPYTGEEIENEDVCPKCKNPPEIFDCPKGDSGTPVICKLPGKEPLCPPIVCNPPEEKPLCQAIVPKPCDKKLSKTNTGECKPFCPRETYKVSKLQPSPMVICNSSELKLDIQEKGDKPCVEPLKWPSKTFNKRICSLESLELPEKIHSQELKSLSVSQLNTIKEANKSRKNLAITDSENKYQEILQNLESKTPRQIKCEVSDEPTEVKKKTKVGAENLADHKFYRVEDKQSEKSTMSDYVSKQPKTSVVCKSDSKPPELSFVIGLKEQKNKEPPIPKLTQKLREVPLVVCRSKNSLTIRSSKREQKNKLSERNPKLEATKVPPVCGLICKPPCLVKCDPMPEKMMELPDSKEKQIKAKAPLQPDKNKTLTSALNFKRKMEPSAPPPIRCGPKPLPLPPSKFKLPVVKLKLPTKTQESPPKIKPEQSCKVSLPSDETITIEKICRSKKDSETVKSLKSVSLADPVSSAVIKVDSLCNCDNKKTQEIIKESEQTKHELSKLPTIEPKCKPCREASNINTMTEKINTKCKATETHPAPQSIISVTDMEQKQNIELSDLTIDESGKVIVNPDIKQKKQIAELLSVKDVIDRGELDLLKILKLREVLQLPCTQSVPCGIGKKELKGNKDITVNICKTVSFPRAFRTGKRKNKDDSVRTSLFSINTCKSMPTQRSSLFNQRLKIINAFRRFRSDFSNQRLRPRDENQCEKDNTNIILYEDTRTEQTSKSLTETILNIDDEQVGDENIDKKEAVKIMKTKHHSVVASIGTDNLQLKSIATMVDSGVQSSENDL